MTIMIFAVVMSTITTATLYKLDDMLTLHTVLTDWNTK